MKLNNKGFAITSIIYSMLILFLTLVVLIIGNLASRKAVFDRQKKDILDKYNVYYNGEIVYFDVVSGEKCINYKTDNSKTGYNGFNNKKLAERTTGTYTEASAREDGQTTCLKFYAFDDSTKSDRLKLILDHNTTGMVSWNSSGYNTNGMYEVLEALENDTRDWNGTEYQYYDVIDPSTKKKSHKKYNARLATTSELARVIGIYNFDSTTRNCTLFEDASLLNGRILNIEEGKAKYAWLFNYINNCQYDEKTNTKAGCSYETSMSDSDHTYGYWLSTPISNDIERAWVVEWWGGLCVSEIKNTNDDGLRPVIEVLKSKLEISK